MRRIQFKYVGNRNNRRDKRQSAPILRVLVGDDAFEAADWSLGGVRLYGIPDGAEPDEQVQVTFEGERGGRSWSGSATALFVWIDRYSGECGLRFTNLPNASFDALETLVTGITRR
jgi:hypothetical protein